MADHVRLLAVFINFLFSTRKYTAVCCVLAAKYSSSTPNKWCDIYIVWYLTSSIQQSTHKLPLAGCLLYYLYWLLDALSQQQGQLSIGPLITRNLTTGSKSLIRRLLLLTCEAIAGPLLGVLYYTRYLVWYVRVQYIDEQDARCTRHYYSWCVSLARHWLFEKKHLNPNQSQLVLLLFEIVGVSLLLYQVRRSIYIERPGTAATAATTAAAARTTCYTTCCAAP